MKPSDIKEPDPKRESNMSLATTPTMRRKAHSLSRCFISIMKFWRVFNCNKKKRRSG